jgi:hypothetical protein
VAETPPQQPPQAANPFSIRCKMVHRFPSGQPVVTAAPAIIHIRAGDHDRHGHRNRYRFSISARAVGVRLFGLPQRAWVVAVTKVFLYYLQFQGVEP